jgi:hypothetical protein
MDGALQSSEADNGTAQREKNLPAIGASGWLIIAIVCLLSSWYFAVIIAPAGLGASAPNVRQGLFPEWYGSRQILLQGRDPYTPETTKGIQAAIYGETAEADRGTRNQHRFAYPAFFALLIFPLAILPFSAAQWVALAGCMVATALSVPFWLGQRHLRLNVSICGVFVFASYPVVLGLQLRQPTLIVAGVLAAVVYCARADRLVLAGILAALSTCKPQLAIAVLVPLAIWAITQWRTRKRFLVAAGGALGALLLASEFISSGWFTHWLSTLMAYAHYAGTKPLLADLLGSRFFMPFGMMLVGAVVWVSCRYCDRDLLFAVSFSITAFQLLFPFQIYNEVLLAPAALWLAKHASEIKSRGQLHALLYCCTWIVLGAGWAATIGLSLSNLLSPGSGVNLWQLPLLTAWLYPLPVFVTLALYALPAPERIQRCW